MTQKAPRTLYRVGLLLALLTLIISPLTSQRPVQAASLQSEMLTGWFSIVWGDGQDSSAAPQQRYVLTSADGVSTSLSLDEGLASASGGILFLNGKQVTVQGAAQRSLSGAGAFQVASIASLQAETESSVAPLAVTGSRPWISIMCKFSDVATEPKDLAYFANMYGDTKPGLNHYWMEVSYNQANVAGSTASGWFVLPHPEAYYNPTDTLGGTNLSLLADDCIGVADPTIDFSPYTGINMMFNTDFDNGYAWGGGRYMTLDGVTKVWSITWEPPWGYGNVTVMAHEMGHGFGLPHSSGEYGKTYDNSWDVMSDAWANCSLATDPTYGCMAQHTISFHKDYLGWIPANQRFRPIQAGTATITLERLALPQTSNYKIAQIPINGSLSHFYTVEVRKKNGYDVKLAGQAVIIHDVDMYRGIPAHVIDEDNNGITGDAGAMWTVGETFTDATNGISVSVVSATTTGFKVSITSPGPKVKSMKSNATNDGWVLESSEFSNKGGSLNSGNAIFNLGDNAQDKQFRAILSFYTAGLPDNATIVRAVLKIRKQGLVGTNPFTTHGGLKVDIRKGMFGSTPQLQLVDFNAQAHKNAIGTFGKYPKFNWYSAALQPVSFPYINLTGNTQVRLRFLKDDNDDKSADYVKFFSGNTATASYRPQLIIYYYVP